MFQHEQDRSTMGTPGQMFSISFDAEDGVFVYGDGYDDRVEELDNLIGQSEVGKLSQAKYIKELKDLVERHPNFIDGHAHLGFAMMTEDKPKLAHDSFLRGFAVGEGLIPSNYPGLIEWGWLENRPFLRAAHGLALCHLRRRKRRDALALMEKMLAWNPNDNQGIRHLIGPEYMRAGHLQTAREILTQEAEYYPPYYYDFGLLLYRQTEFTAAATSLRHGFVKNAYIAEMLCGTPEPMLLAIWHGSSSEGPETAEDYLSQCADLWLQTPGALEFLRWVHTHPRILAERGAIFAAKEALLWEHDYEERAKLVAAEQAAFMGIDDWLSEEIVKPRTDRQGRHIAPWLSLLLGPHSLG